MANHQVIMEIQAQTIRSKDVIFVVKVKSDSGSHKKIGELLVSQGAIEWRKTRNSVNRKFLNWEKFSELMEEHGRTRRGQP